MAKSYVKSLTVATSGKSSSFGFATPDEFMTPTGAINVICGENGAGKSFLIRALDGLVSEEGRKAMYSGYTLETTLAEVQPAIVRIEPWNNLSFAGQIFFDRRSDYTQSRDEKRLIPLRFWVDLIKAYRSYVEGDPFNEAEWLANYDHRKAVFETIHLSHVLPLATFLESDLIVAFEEMFDCQLGLRVKSQTLELTMDNDFGLFPFQNWSQGQKTIFNTLQIMHYSDASVFLFDEIENNLHPASISKLMRRMKLSRGSQFIITSHHPHVIFSKFADRSLFIERVKPMRSRRGVSYENEGKKASIHRRVFSLEKATEKFRATYQLFDSSDVELLEQASSIRSALEARIYTDIFQNIGFQVVAEKPGPFADNQTMHMVETMKGLDPGFGEFITVLDYGSGLCRVAHEFGKIYQQPGKRKFRWIFWEPNVATRLVAQETMPKSDDFIFLEEAPTDLGQLGQVDLMLITNVLHELSPTAIAAALTTAHTVLGTKGHLIVNELYPLLEFEEDAVPFRPGDMKSLLSESGFLADVTTSPLRSTMAYAAVAKPRLKADEAQIYEAVLRTFGAMLKDRLASHGVGLAPTNQKRIAEKIQDYATIATLSSYFARNLVVDEP